MNDTLRKKTAIAVACIAMKPLGMTCEEFVGKLCSDYQTSQQKWKDRCLDAETEILHLKQQLIMSTFESLPSLNCTEDTNVLQQDILPTPPSSGTPKENADEATNKFNSSKRISLQHHAKYLQSVIHLQKINHVNPTVQGVTESSIHQCLDIFQECVQDEQCSVPVSSLQNCANLVSKLTRDKHRVISSRIKEHIEQILYSVIDRLFSSTYTNQWSDHRALLNLLHSLLTECHMKPVFSKFLQKLDRFSEHLKEVCAGKEPLDIISYNNMAYTVELFEVLFNHPCQCFRNDREFWCTLRDQLENSLLHVTERFPLYAHAVWILCGHVDSLLC